MTSCDSTLIGSNATFMPSHIGLLAWPNARANPGSPGQTQGCGASLQRFGRWPDRATVSHSEAVSRWRPGSRRDGRRRRAEASTSLGNALAAPALGASEGHAAAELSDSLRAWAKGQRRTVALAGTRREHGRGEIDPASRRPSVLCTLGARVGELLCRLESAIEFWPYARGFWPGFLEPQPTPAGANGPGDSQGRREIVLALEAWKLKHRSLPKNCQNWSGRAWTSCRSIRIPFSHFITSARD